MAREIAAKERRVRPAGLGRCCTSTLAIDDTPSVVGTVLDCLYEDKGNAKLIVAEDGVWEWNRSEAPLA